MKFKKYSLKKVKRTIQYINIMRTVLPNPFNNICISEILFLSNSQPYISIS